MKEKIEHLERLIEANHNMIHANHDVILALEGKVKVLTELFHKSDA